MRLLVLALFACCTATVAHAEPEPHYVVTLALVQKRAELTRAVLNADEALGLPLAADTLTSLPTAPKHAGLVVSAYAPRRNELRLTAYIGDDEGTAKLVLSSAQRRFPKARIERISIERSSLSDDYLAYSYSDVLVVATYPTFEEAAREAKRVAAATHLEYDTRGLILVGDALVWPEDAEMDGGSYLSRRSGDRCGDARSGACLSVEMSEAYAGVPGRFAVIGGINASEDLARIQRSAPHAHIQKIALYQGCRH